jgi:hypothetical protein
MLEDVLNTLNNNNNGNGNNNNNGSSLSASGGASCLDFRRAPPDPNGITATPGGRRYLCVILYPLYFSAPPHIWHIWHFGIWIGFVCTAIGCARFAFACGSIRFDRSVGSPQCSVSTRFLNTFCGVVWIEELAD